MTLFILKILAMLTMTIDHVASSFLGNMTALRVIGRLAFLLYAFMIAEGFNHIKDKPDRVRSHLIKLSVLCVISEFVYDFYETGELIDWSSQSVMPVLMLGLESTATAIGLRRLAAAVLDMKFDRIQPITAMAPTIMSPEKEL